MQIKNYIDELTVQGKITPMESQDYSLRLSRIEGYEESEQQIALDTLLYEIRKRISKVETFDQLIEVENFKKSHGKNRRAERTTRRQS